MCDGKCSKGNKPNVQFFGGYDELSLEFAQLKQRKSWLVALMIVCVTIILLSTTACSSQTQYPASNSESSSTNSADDEVAHINDYELLGDYAFDLGIRRHEVDYLWQARSDSNTPWFRWVVGDGIEDGVPIGSRIADFDGDGVNELLIVRWQAGSVVLEMYEIDDSKVAIQAKATDYATGFPIEGIGCLDVTCDAASGIVVQWWYHMSPVSDVHMWELDRYTYDGTDFVSVGNAVQEGTSVGALDNLKSQLNAIDVPNESIPVQGADYDVLSSMLCERESSLQLVTRILAGTNPTFLSTEEYYATARQSGDQWSAAEKFGTFVITQMSEEGTFWPEYEARPVQEKSVQAYDGYVLSGTVCVHDEFMYSTNQSVTVVSMVLDTPVSYTYEYKGTIDAEAHEVALETSVSDGFGAWTQYDGQHITVVCEDLRGVYHDASYFNVDALAQGDIHLVS